MIRKLLILVLILIPIVLLGHYQFGHFKAYNRITAKRDIANGQIKFIIFGELDPNEELHNKAANELGFEYIELLDVQLINLS